MNEDVRDGNIYKVTVSGGDEYTVERTVAPRCTIVFNIMTEEFKDLKWLSPEGGVANLKFKAKRAVEKFILGQASVKEFPKAHIQKVLQLEDFWGDITNNEYVEKAKEFLWNNLSLKAKASVVYQANRDEIQKERAEKEPKRKIEKENRREHTKKVTGVAMSFVFED